MTRDELLFMAKEFLNSEKWHVALTKGNDFIAQQATLADFGEEVLRVEKAREEALES